MNTDPNNICCTCCSFSEVCPHVRVRACVCAHMSIVICNLLQQVQHITIYNNQNNNLACCTSVLHFGFCCTSKCNKGVSP